MYLRHITQDGDRWDLLAYRYYQDVSQMSNLITANPHVPIDDVLAGGLELAIPIIETAVENEQELPAWKR